MCRFFFSSRRRHTRCGRDWSSDVCSSDLILRDGGAAFAGTGTPDSTGTRLFCLSGHVRAPGVYEVPLGTTLRALIDLAGGLREGRSLRAVLLGGAAGSFLTGRDLDVPLS